MQPSSATLSAAFTSHYPELVTNLQRGFPRLCRSAVEDAVAYAFLVAAEQPERFAAVRATSDGAGWLYVIAWRRIRHLVRRQHFRVEPDFPDGAAQLSAQPPGQETAAQLHLELEVLAHEAARSVNTRFAEQIQQALADKMLTGDTDSAVARRCGVRREYLNRAKAQLRAAL